MNDQNKPAPAKLQTINRAIRQACEKNFGVLDTGFLCQTLSIVNPRPALCVKQTATIEEVISLLRKEKRGCVLITSDDSKVVGIFSERDVLLKISENFAQLLSRPVSEFMTKEPVCESPDITIAYALNLMSAGGFRHLPLVDKLGVSVGLISVKDLLDHIAGTLTTDLLDFETSQS